MREEWGKEKLILTVWISYFPVREGIDHFVFPMRKRTNGRFNTVPSNDKA